MIKVALVQRSAVANDKEKNLDIILASMHEAKQLSADIVLFPEMFSNGYAAPFEGAFDNPNHPDFECERKQWLKQAIAFDDLYITKVKDLCVTLNIGVVLTMLSVKRGKYYNTALVIDRKGKIILDYDKVHTCDFSLEKLLNPGQSFEICEFDGVKIGIMICYDREFPESARELMLAGAELILVPNACDFNPARESQLKSRAFENMVGIAMANYPGVGWGQSCAYSPVVFDHDGRYCDNTLLKLEEVEESIEVVSFDMNVIRSYRQTETWGNAYRKPVAYKRLTAETVKEPFIRKD